QDNAWKNTAGIHNSLKVLWFTETSRRTGVSGLPGWLTGDLLAFQAIILIISTAFHYFPCPVRRWPVMYLLGEH
ncbi:MAG: hypothetical protein O7C61_11725, partial [SAR324 cluster bacterium]|nr:hypothetical protein [SAR324 cluster bacterium]